MSVQEIKTLPLIEYFSGNEGMDHAIETRCMGMVIANDGMEPIQCRLQRVGQDDLTFMILPGEVLDDMFGPVASFSMDPENDGVPQKETATLAAGEVTEAGDMAVIFTAALLDGGEKTLLIPVTTDDTTPALIMEKVRAAFAADADIIAEYTIGGATNTITAQKKGRAAANDSTLNFDLGGAGTTAVGITRVASSANTTAGVAPNPIKYRVWARG